MVTEGRKPNNNERRRRGGAGGAAARPPKNRCRVRRFCICCNRVNGAIEESTVAIVRNTETSLAVAYAGRVHRAAAVCETGARGRGANRWRLAKRPPAGCCLPPSEPREPCGAYPARGSGSRRRPATQQGKPRWVSAKGERCPRGATASRPRNAPSGSRKKSRAKRDTYAPKPPAPSGGGSGATSRSEAGDAGPREP